MEAFYGPFIRSQKRSGSAKPGFELAGPCDAPASHRRTDFRPPQAVRRLVFPPPALCQPLPDFATSLIAAKPVKSCDGGVCGFLNLRLPGWQPGVWRQMASGRWVRVFLNAARPAKKALFGKAPFDQGGELIRPKGRSGVSAIEQVAFDADAVADAHVGRFAVVKRA